MTIFAIIKRNKYFNKDTYITFADALTCFDNLWLEDGICDLWKSGTRIRDCITIKRMNEKANVIIRTPVGETKRLKLENVVRQGTIYGPEICGASMDEVNGIGKEVVTTPMDQIYQ